VARYSAQIFLRGAECTKVYANGSVRRATGTQMKIRLTLGAGLLKYFYWIWLALLAAFAGAALFNFVLTQL
jgi:hypothetical protein